MNRPHWADGVIAVFTILIFFTYITSDYFLWKQLGLTRDAIQQGTNNNTAAIQAQERIASEALKSSNESFDKTLSQMKEQTKAQASFARAAERAAATGAKQLELAERPWLTASTSIASPLTFDVNGARLTFQLVLRNTGRSAAFFYVRTTFWPVGSNEEAIQERDRLCKATEEFMRATPAFPETIAAQGEPVIENLTEGLGTSQIERTEASYHSISPIFIACVGYKPTFADTYYETAYIFEVSEIHPDNPQAVYAIDVSKREEIPLNRLRLQFAVAGGSYAK